MAKNRYLILGFDFQFIMLWRDFWSIKVIITQFFRRASLHKIDICNININDK